MDSSIIKKKKTVCEICWYVLTLLKCENNIKIRLVWDLDLMYRISMWGFYVVSG
uniref:Uncharacterized protein n=1 Tax=Rhizophora mucronata TaxID=61149 RepID=A0A2P2R2A2_RHIMU